jgi:hypothetical protein
VHLGHCCGGILGKSWHPASIAHFHDARSGNREYPCRRHGDIELRALRQFLFPIEIRLFGKTVFSGPESPEVDARYPTYLLIGSREVSLPEPINLFLSATETDWTMRGVAPWYNIDSLT